MMCLLTSYKNKIYKKYYFWPYKSMKKKVGSGVGHGSGSISHRYGSGLPDPNPHQNVTGPQHCQKDLNL
jgi:hypothetical protein